MNKAISHKATARKTHAAEASQNTSLNAGVEMEASFACACPTGSARTCYSETLINHIITHATIALRVFTATRDFMSGLVTTEAIRYIPTLLNPTMLLHNDVPTGGGTT